MMTMTDLLARLKQRQDDLGLSERALCRAAGVSEQAVKRLRAGHQPNGATRAKLLAFLGSEAGLALVPDISLPRASPLPARRTVPVIGVADSVRWHPSPLLRLAGEERLLLPALVPAIPRFAVRLSGPGLDRLYPPGTLLVAASYSDLGRPPMPGDRVLLLRQEMLQGWSLGAWEYGAGPDGQGLLWPRSRADGLAQPLVLTVPPALAPVGPDGFPQVQHAAAFTLIGVILHSLQPEPWLADRDVFSEENLGED